MNKSKIVSLISIVVNLFLAVFKLIVGLSFHSVAIIADALHSSLDIFSSVIAYVGIKTSVKPADKEHPYGYERYQAVAGFFIVFLLFISAVWIIYEGFNALRSDNQMAIFSWWSIALIIFSVIVNEIMARIKFKAGSSESSLALISDAEHSRADAISSVAVLAGLFLVKYYIWADGVLAILIGLYIMYESWQLAKQAIDSLVDRADLEIEKEIKKIIEKNQLKYSSIKTRHLGINTSAEIKLICSSKRKIDEVTAITKKLEKELLDNLEKLTQVNIMVESHQLDETVSKSLFGGRYRGARQGSGPGGRCVCPKCGEVFSHQRGVPCHENKCPTCGVSLEREV